MQKNNSHSQQPKIQVGYDLTHAFISSVQVANITIYKQNTHFHFHCKPKNPYI